MIKVGCMGVKCIVSAHVIEPATITIPEYFYCRSKVRSSLVPRLIAWGPGHEVICMHTATGKLATHIL